MYISLFSLVLVIFYYACTIHSQSCDTDNDCHRKESTSLGDLWLCCNKQCYRYRAESKFRCPCSSRDECRTDEACDLDWNRCAVRWCFTDSDCYPDQDDTSWRCCGDKQCHRTQWCPCSSSDECPAGEECRGGRCNTPFIPPGSCEEDSDCGGIKICTDIGGISKIGSCRVDSEYLFLVIFSPILFIAAVNFVVVCLIRRRIRNRLAHARDQRARYRPAVRAPVLQSASTSSRNDSTVTVGQRLTPSAPPLTALENRTEQARDTTITLDTEENTGIPVSSAATTESSDLPSYTELQNRDEEPPPPSYEEVIRNYSAERFV